MVTVDQFCRIQTEVDVLLTSLQATSEYASKLLGFVAYNDFSNDTGEIKSLMPCAIEHFENLQKVAKQTSSLADRFCTSLNKLKSTISEIDNKQASFDYMKARHYFFSAIHKVLLDLARRSNIKFTFNDSLTYSDVDVVDLNITKNGKPAFIVIKPTHEHDKMIITYHSNVTHDGCIKYASLTTDNIDESINQIVTETVDYLNNI